MVLILSDAVGHDVQRMFGHVEGLTELSAAGFDHVLLAGNAANGEAEMPVHISRHHPIASNTLLVSSQTPRPRGMAHNGGLELSTGALSNNTPLIRIRIPVIRLC